MKLHRRKNFSGGEIIVDDQSYDDCTFGEVTFVYNGGRVSFVGCWFSKCKIRSDSETIREAWAFYKGMSEMTAGDEPVALH